MAAAVRLTKEKAQAAVIEAVAQGATIEQAVIGAGRSLKTHEEWRRLDKEYASSIDNARAARKAARSRGAEDYHSTIGFAEFRKKYLFNDTYPHQEAWIDLLEGRPYEPRPGEVYEPSHPNRIVVNVPPFHGKSATITVDYVVYRICMNPNIRILIVSKKQSQAAKFLYMIQLRLTEPTWSLMQSTFGPEGGFRPDQKAAAKWGANAFYIRGIDSGEKDPTVEAAGMGGQIYGNRCDLIILDDCVDDTNAAQYEKQITWIDSVVESRVGSGKILIVGTRLAPTDLYSEIRSPDRYMSNKSPWSYLAQPAVLEFAEDPKDWKTLWPYSSRKLNMDDQPGEDGLYPAWPGPRMAEVRQQKTPRVWSLVYMQQEVADDAVFDPLCVRGSVDGRRKPGPLKAGAWGHPRAGAEGMRVIMSWDPAGTGKAFVLIGAADRATKQRYVLNAWTATNTTPRWYLGMLEQHAEAYGVTELVIESNAYSSWLIHDSHIIEFCRDRGIKITPHYTGTNKQDPNFGVSTLAPLFGTVRRIHDGNGRPEHNNDNVLWLPDPNQSEGIRALCDQLITWRPNVRGGKLVQDGPMALWFFELRARDAIGIGKGNIPKFRDSPYTSRGAQAQRRVISVSARRAATAYASGE